MRTERLKDTQSDNTDRQTHRNTDRKVNRELRKHTKIMAFLLYCNLFSTDNILFLNVLALSKEIVKFLFFGTLLGYFTNPIYLGLGQCEKGKKERMK